MRTSVSLSLAGFLATAITYGPARMGFGLFLPEFRESFSISTERAGLIVSAGFLGFLIALPVSGAMLARAGPRLPVLAGGVVAALGLGIVAAAPDALILSAGVVLALSSAGFSWAPFNNAAERLVAEESRPHVLSVVSTGTTVGVATAGVLALVLVFNEFTWRAAWAAFAAGGALVVAVNWAALGSVAGDAGDTGRSGLGQLARKAAVPVFATAVSFGTTSAIYISFAADRIAQAGGLPGLPGEASAALVFIAYGVAGLVGLATGGIEKRIGLARLVRVIFLASALSLALVALAPTSWPAVVVSAGLQGGCVMTISAVFAFWTARLFPGLPSLSFTAVLMGLAAGSVAGPAAAGVVSGAFGAGTMFLGTAAISLATAVAARPAVITDKAAG